MPWYRSGKVALKSCFMAFSTVFGFVKFFLIQCFSAICRKCLTVGSWYAGGIESVRLDHEQNRREVDGEATCIC